MSVALVTSCGGDKSQTSSNDDTIEVIDEIGKESATSSDNVAKGVDSEEPAEEESEDIYRPPFKVTVIRQYVDGGWEEKDTYIFNILKNGRLSGTTTYERRDSRFKGSWEQLGETIEFGGKWSKSLITMGDGSLDVYAIDKSNSSSTIYLPATCDYIWMCNDAWYECENWNLDLAMKVTSVEKL